MYLIDNDLLYTWNSLSKNEKEKLLGAKILISGIGGFLGQYYVRFFARYFDELKLKKIVGIDNYLLGKSALIKSFEKDERFVFYTCCLGTDSIECFGELEDVDYVIYLASIASPVYYRKHPIDTIDSNVWGLRALLEYYKDKEIKGFLFYSSSEVYGDPFSEYIPSNEDYYGNTSTIGPRACYDESKRYGETLCYVFYMQYEMPIRIVRLFNVYGPGLKLNDGRVTSDFARMIVDNDPIVIYSDGTPTRSFSYVADSVIGELKALLYDGFECFNIGVDNHEITIKDFAELCKMVGEKVCSYSKDIVFRISDDINYLVHNPQRRVPDISKAKKLLGYSPKIKLEDGFERYLRFIIENKEEQFW